MKEIKLRAYIKKSKRLRKVDGIDLLNKIVTFQNYCNKSHYVFNEVILEQLTGLKDKNGKEIYEGDVVASHNGVYQGFVVFRPPSFVIKEKLRGKTWSNFIIAPSENQLQEVIGNIHENPELLKGKHENTKTNYRAISRKTKQ